MFADTIIHNAKIATNGAPAFVEAVAIHANYWQALWIYFIAPSLGMLTGAEVFLRLRGGAAPYCAKLHHANNKCCIFHHAQPGALFREKVIHSEQANQRGGPYANTST
jgi:hypothetical protein